MSTHHRHHPCKVTHRLIVDRQKVKAKPRGFYWLLTLECKHVVRLPDFRGDAKKTHCEKCSLGLVAA